MSRSIVLSWLIISCLTVLTKCETGNGICKWSGLNPGALILCSSSIGYKYEATCENRVKFSMGTCEDYVSMILEDDFYKYNMTIHIHDPQERNLLDVQFNTYQDVFIDKLILEEGSLTKIPNEIFDLARLKKLKVQNNNIRTITFTDFLKIPILDEIDFADNDISLIETGEVAGNSNVKKISLNYNIIEKLPNYFLKQYSELESLQMRYNKIDNIGLQAFDGISQLKVLDISHNRLNKVSSAFAKLVYLQELNLSHNNLEKLLEYNFVTMSNLEKLYLNSNNIDTIEEDTFQALTKLNILDLSNNEIKTISKQLFSSNVNLYSLLLDNNQIYYIEPNSFKQNIITTFSIQNNILTNLQNDEFAGVIVGKLDLSRQNITIINEKSFANMFELQQLNLSSNSIHEIPHLAFSSLTSLHTLDLSNNDLEELNFESYGLRQLSELYVQSNRIVKIVKNIFDNFASLEILNLSGNTLKEIEPSSFANMKSLKNLVVVGNDFVDILESNTFRGLENVTTLEMSHTKTTVFKNDSFSGMISLSHLDSSSGNLKEIEYNAFSGCSSLTTLNLKSNDLISFHINTSYIQSIKEIFLSNNKIRKITGETFSKLFSLETLELDGNEIASVDSAAFINQINLKYLELSSNAITQIANSTFHNAAQLVKLNLSNNFQMGINFGHLSPVIKFIRLQLCGITDLNEMNLFDIRNVTEIDLSHNGIPVINKDVFRTMPSLVVLDLSDNLIKYIQPGSFLHVKNLEFLNLSNNRLVFIQFGVFDGPVLFNSLNLSHNELRTFNVKMLPQTKVLSLEYNRITRMSFDDVCDTNVDKLYIGSNQFACDDLVQLKTSNNSDKLKRIITASPLNYYSENVDGITCRSDNTKEVAYSNDAAKEGSLLISILKNATEKLSKTEKSLVDFMESSNRYLAMLTALNNDTNIQVREIKNAIVNVDDKTNNMTTEAMAIQNDME